MAPLDLGASRSRSQRAAPSDSRRPHQGRDPARPPERCVHAIGRARWPTTWRPRGFDPNGSAISRGADVGGPQAIPVLLRWLPRIANDDVKVDIVAALASPWARPGVLAPLVAEYRKSQAAGPDGARHPRRRSVPPWPGSLTTPSPRTCSRSPPMMPTATSEGWRSWRWETCRTIAIAIALLVELLDEPAVTLFAVLGLSPGRRSPGDAGAADDSGPPEPDRSSRPAPDRASMVSTRSLSRWRLADQSVDTASSADGRAANAVTMDGRATVAPAARVASRRRSSRVSRSSSATLTRPVRSMAGATHRMMSARKL